MWVGERVAMLNATEIIVNTLLKKVAPPWGPNAIFRYPMDGTGQIWDALYNTIPQVV